MGVEFWAVSGPGRWLQGCMRVRLLWPDINDWSPLVSNGPSVTAHVTAHRSSQFHRVQNSLRRGAFHGMPSVFQDQVYTGSRYTLVLAMCSPTVT